MHKEGVFHINGKDAKIRLAFSLSFLLIFLVMMWFAFAESGVTSLIPTDGTNASATINANGSTSFNGANPSFSCFVETRGNASINATNVSLYISGDALPTSAASLNMSKNISLGSSSSLNYSFNTSLLSDGVYVWFCEVADNGTHEYNTNTTRNATLIIDRTAPTMIVGSLSNNSASGVLRTSSNLFIGLNVTDLRTKIHGVKMLVNISGPYTEVNLSGQSANNSAVNLTYFIPSTQSGQVLRFVFSANDSLNNTANISSLLFTVSDGTVPGPFNQINPVNGFNTSSSTITFNFTVADNVASQNLTCRINVTSNGAEQYTYSNATVTPGQNVINSTTFSTGHYSWSVNCTDAAGNANHSTTQSFTIDQAAPTFSNSSISHSTISTSNTIALGAQVQDTFSLNLSSVRLLVNGAQASIVRGSENKSAVNFTYLVGAQLVGTTVNFSIQANDSLGNVDIVTLGLVTVNDGTGPAISLSAPVNGVNTSNPNVTFTFTATDNNDTTLHCDINATLGGAAVSILSSMSVVNGTAYTNSTSLTNGTYTWKVNCTDSASNLNSSAAQTFTVDTLAPTATNASISNTTIRANDLVSMGAVFDGTFSAIRQIQLRVNISGTNTTVNTTLSGSASGANTTINLTFRVNASFEGQVFRFSMLGNDSAGNSVVIDAPSLVTMIDTIGPSIVINSPSNRSNISTTNVTINFTATDTVSTTFTCNVSIDQFNGSVSVNLSTIPVTSGVPSVNFTTPFSQGGHNISVRCVDGSENQGEVLYVNFTVDSIAPTATLSALTPNSSLVPFKQSFIVTTADATSGVFTRRYITSCGTSASFTSAVGFNPFNESGTSCSGTNGTRTLIINVTDHAGNVNQTIYTFFVDGVAPNITAHSPRPGQTFSAVNATLNYTALDVFANISLLGYYLASANAGYGALVTINLSLYGFNAAGVATTIPTTSLNLTAGEYSVIFTVNDTSGNFYNHTAISFNITGPINPATINSSITTYVSSTAGLPANVTVRVQNADGTYSEVGAGNQSDSTGTFEIALSVNNSGAASSALGVSLTEINGAGANWGQTNFPISLNDSSSRTQFRNNFTASVFSMVILNGSIDNFLPNPNDYFGIVNLSFNLSQNTSTAQQIWYFETDGDFTTRTNVSQCTSVYTRTTTTPCWNYTSQGRTLVFVPHFSGVAVGNDTEKPTVNVTTPADLQGVSTFTPVITVSSDAVSCIYHFNRTTNATPTQGMSKSGTTCTGGVESLRNGPFNMTFNVTDSSGNVNVYSWNFTISDATAPNTPLVSNISTNTSLFLTISGVNESVNVNISYGTLVSALNQTSLSSSFNQTHTINLTSLTLNTTYFVNVSVCDFNNNCAKNATLTFTTAGPANTGGSSSGNGGSSGGGGSSTTTTTTVASTTKVWDAIESGVSTTLSVNKEGLAISSITFEPTADLNDAELGVSSLSKNPLTTTPANNVFQYLQISTKNIPAASLGGATIKFTIPSTWIAANSIKNEDVVLYRYASGKWNALETTYLGGDKYSAVTPGFSYFAIGAQDSSTQSTTTDKSTTDSTTTQSTTPDTTAPDQTSTEQSSEQSADQESAPAKRDWKMALIVAAILLIAVGVFVMYKKN